MTNLELIDLIDQLRAEPAELEWLEFKETKVQPPEKFGEYISALSNGAALSRKQKAFLLLGIHDKTHEVVGTSYNLHKALYKGQNLLFWTTRELEPRTNIEVYEVEHPNGRVVVITIEPARSRPVKFCKEGFIRISGSKTSLNQHPQKEAMLWRAGEDWSAEVVPSATLENLDDEALAKARREYIQKNPNKAEEAESWDTATFLNKAKVMRQGQITHTALLLLGKPDSSTFLSPAVAHISWLLKDDKNNDLDYEHFEPPFIVNVDYLLGRVRNRMLRTLPDGTLFPREIQQYDAYVLREALHNAIAHQDHSLQGRIHVVEHPESLLITNVGSFLPGTVERVIDVDAPQEIYRNPFLARAMVNLNMIDTQGGGIRRMFQRQRERFLPLPDYDLSESQRVKVSIPGRILDEQYTKLLMQLADLELWQVQLLDQVQKRKRISHEAHIRLRQEGLVEGRYPRTIISAAVARATGLEAAHIQARGFDNKYYRDLIVELIREHSPISRAHIDALLINKLPSTLNMSAKRNKIHNMLSYLSQTGKIENQGSRQNSQWVLVEE